MEDSFEVKVELVEIVVGNHSTHPLRLYDLGAKNWLDENMHWESSCVDNENTTVFLHVLQQIDGLFIFRIVRRDLLIVFPVNLEFPQRPHNKCGIFIEIEVFFSQNTNTVRIHVGPIDIYIRHFLL